MYIEKLCKLIKEINTYNEKSGFIHKYIKI